MKFGVTIPNNWGVADPQQVVALGPLAEKLGYDSLWVMDHLFNTGYIRERLENRPYYHPLSTLSYLAATTQWIRLGTSVLVLPYHNPVDLAKYAATLDQLSGGRVTLGVGVGAMAEEFQALGIPIRRRGSLTDESIAIMKELWTNDGPSFSSQRWSFSDVLFSPKPVQQPHIPLWIGGSSPAAMRRVGEAGDGWHPTGLSPEEFSLGKLEIERIAAAAGRSFGAIVMSTRVEVEISGKPAGSRTSGRARIPGDNSSKMISSLQAYQTAGVEHVVLAPNSGDVPTIRSLMETIARDVIPQFR